MIICKALEEKSVFVTAKGDILPCCHMYRGGPALNDELKNIVNDKNFQGLIDSWNTPTPYHMCSLICDNVSSSPLSMKKFEDQWKNKDSSYRR
jgi:hypothetical protein